MKFTDQSIDGWILGAPSNPATQELETPLDALPIFGIGAVGPMLVSYALEAPARRFTLAFAAASAVGSICAFLQGAWPIGSAEIVGALVALGAVRAPD